MNIDLSACKAVVTSSTAGIGLVTAWDLVASGASVTIKGRSAERVRSAVATVSTPTS